MGKPPRRRSLEPEMRAMPMPDELVMAILELLPFYSLRSAAAVSRQFYKAAWSAGLYIHTVMDCSGWDRHRPSIHVQLDQFNQVLEHALRKDLRLSLRLTFNYARLVSDPPDDQDALSEILLALTSALPVLVALDIAIPDELSSKVSAALQHPAPRLRSLSLFGFHFDEHFSPVSISPRSFLCGYAPRLSELDLCCSTLGRENIPAFSNVVRLKLVNLCCKEHPPGPLSLHFPRLAIVHFEREGRPEYTIPPTSIDCDGLALKSLSFYYRDGDDMSIAPRLEYNKIPEFRYLCGRASHMDWREPVGWRTDGGELSMRVSKHRTSTLLVAVVSSDNSWRRSYSVYMKEEISWIQLNNMPGLPPRLAYLRIDATYLLAFLLNPSSYPVLRCIRVDIQEPEHDKYRSDPVDILFYKHHRDRFRAQQARPRRLSCPTLETLSFFSTAPIVQKDSDSRQTDLRYEDVAFLRQALSPLANPVLELVAVHVANCDYHATRDSEKPVLSHLFSAIHQIPYPGWRSCAYFDNGLWEEYPYVAGGDHFPVCLPKP